MSELSESVPGTSVSSSLAELCLRQRSSSYTRICDFRGMIDFQFLLQGVAQACSTSPPSGNLVDGLPLVANMGLDSKSNTGEKRQAQPMPT